MDIYGISGHKFFLLSFSACVLSHRKSSDKWEELSHNYVLRAVYQGGFPSLETVHSPLNLIAIINIHGIHKLICAQLLSAVHVYRVLYVAIYSQINILSLYVASIHVKMNLRTSKRITDHTQ